ncbi:hypothetical protein [Chryseobacterium gregarium]|uniref:hypothetical protein n=1 Tax=Chryseobacterium gregarium TaxID=456299 RepID=UPI0004278EEA|nr:hypothetical protein [Chryseobacterium gregarium]
MKYYQLYPEVAGTLTEDCIDDAVARPVKISKMNYEFDGWLGDDLVTEAGHFIVAEKLAEALMQSMLSGFNLGKATTSKSEQFEEMYPDRILPVFKWLRINGESKQDDFWFSKESMMLYVSEKAYDVLKDFQLANCDLEVIEE